MRSDKNGIIAWLVLCACVITGIFGLGGLHLQRSRAAVLDVFYNGTGSAHSGGSSMNALLKRAGQCAQTMAAEAGRYLGADHPVAAAMLENAALMDEKIEMDDRCGAYMHIRNGADALCNAMYALNLLDGERAGFKRAYDDFWRCDSCIRREPYREMAADYNHSIEAFPANLVAEALGAGKLNSFGG